MPRRTKPTLPVPEVGRELRRELESKKRASVAQLLFKVARLVNERAIERLEREGGASVLKPAVAALLPHLDYDGVRVVDLAKKLGVSKQAVSQTLAELVDQGLVELLPDPDDGRAKRARFTKKGALAIAQGLTVLRAIEQDLADAIGTASFETLHGTLLRLETVLTEPTDDPDDA